MPIYAYRCEDCGHAQDFLQKISDPLMDTCPSCGSKGFRKQVTAAGFQLKGEGWYVTDFRDGGKKDAKKAGEGEGDGKRAAAESGSEAKSEGKSEGKADTKSDGKGDAKSGSEADVKPAKPSTPAPASAPSKPTSGGDTKAA